MSDSRFVRTDPPATADDATMLLGLPELEWVGDGFADDPDWEWTSAIRESIDGATDL